MNKVEYMKELERLLLNIPEAERKEALTYYEEYFSDAGVENEQKVIEELGYPMKVAENIKEGLRGNMGYQNYGAGYQNTGYQHIGTQNVYAGADTVKKEALPAWAIVLIVFGCIIASPLLLAGFGTLLGAILSVIMTLFGAIIAFAAGGLSLFIVAVACFVFGIGLLASAPLTGMGLIGGGLICAALGVLFLMFTVWLCGWALPTFIKWIIKMFRKLKKKDVAAA